MHCVDQTILGKGEEAAARGEEPGDCLRACVASLLDLPSEHVPNFVHTGSDPYGLWRFALIGWLQVKGYRYEAWLPDDDEARNGYVIQGGPGPRGMRHCVVACDGEMVHDPHPSRDGLLKVDVVYRIRPLGDDQPQQQRRSAR